MILAALMCAVLASSCPAQAPAGAGDKPAPKLEDKVRWVFTFSNFASDKWVQDGIDLMKRAKKAGYNGILVSAVNFERFTLATPQVTGNMKKFRKACTDENMKFIAAVAPFGYCSDLLANDASLAEGIPVRKAAFIVKDGSLAPFDDTTKLVNPSFDQFSGDKPIGWDADDPGKASFADTAVKCDGKSSLRQEAATAANGHCRVSQRVSVLPWHHYHLGVMVKTQGWTGRDMRVCAMAGKPGEEPTVLNWQPIMDGKEWETKDWTRINCDFSSLDNSEVTIMLGCWATKAGKIWWDDVKLEQAGFVNIIRRDSLPLTLTSEDGQTTYDEGKDFAKVVDHKLLNDPQPGCFSIWHDVPAVKIPAQSRLKEGQKVLASYCFATPSGQGGQINMCMAEPKVYEMIEREIQFVKENANPDIYMLSHDEIRECGWDDSCVKTGKTPGQILADCIGKCTRIVKKVDPGKGIVVWNDMFDKCDNASPAPKPFYLVKGKGPWAGSWEGLSADIGVANWHQNSADSLKFFADRGNQQILAGYYDDDPKKIVDWLKTASGTRNVVGVMYTTWEQNYTNLETFIDYVNKFQEPGAEKTK
jgi:hypothetical protein